MKSKIDQNLDSFKKIIAESKSFGEIFNMLVEKLGYKYSWGLRQLIHRKCKEYSIDCSHIKKSKSGPKTDLFLDVDEKKVIQEIKNAKSLRGLAIKIGIEKRGKNYSGSVYRKLYNIINKNKIDISHFSGRLWSRGLNRFINNSLKKQGEKRRNVWDDIFCKNCLVHTHSHTMIEMLIEKKVLEYKCRICGINQWNNNALRLHLDHLNGKGDDNRVENLRLLCPNCHSQTETYCRGIKRKHISVEIWRSKMAMDKLTKK